jgi:hypothetical protein
MGIDFGMAASHGVVLGNGPDRRPRVEAVVLARGADGPNELAALCQGVSHVGIDAPDRQTAGCPEPGKRPGRCAEVALAASGHGRNERMTGGPVSMHTPATGAVLPDRLAWMGAGFELWALLRDRCPSVEFFETYPSGTFRRLAAGGLRPARLIPRGTAMGVGQRAGLLEPLVDGPAFLTMWGLDGVDALAAALAAYRLAVGHGYVVAEHDHDGHDGSRIVLVA